MTRNPDGGKSVCAAVHYARKTGVVKKVFNSKTGLFLQSKKGGNEASRKFLLQNGGSLGMEALLEDMSDSSDEELDITPSSSVVAEPSPSAGSARPPHEAEEIVSIASPSGSPRAPVESCKRAFDLSENEPEIKRARLESAPEYDDL